MKVYAVFRRYGRGNVRFSEWHVYKLFSTKKQADAWISKKNPNACSYQYSAKAMKVEGGDE